MISNIKNNHFDWNTMSPLIPVDLQLPQSRISDHQNIEIYKFDNAVCLLSNKYLDDLDLEVRREQAEPSPNKFTFALLQNTANAIFSYMWAIPCIRGDTISCKKHFLGKFTIKLVSDRLLNKHLPPIQRFSKMALDSLGKGLVLKTCLSNPGECKKAFYTYNTIRYTALYIPLLFTKSFEEVYEDMTKPLDNFFNP